MEAKTKKGIAYYKRIRKEEGWKGLAKKIGPKAAILLFLFFTVKGLIWLFIIYGGVEFIKSISG